MSRYTSTPRPARTSRALLAALAVAGAALAPSVAGAQVPRPSAWITNGRVLTSAYNSSNNVIYLGGTFSQVGPAVGAAAALDATSGTAQQPYARVVGTVMAVAPDGSGGWYLGGSFTSVQDQPRSNLAQIDANGAVTSWNPGADGEVDAIAVSGGNVYVGGLFAHVGGGASRAYIAALSPSTGAATAWAPTVNGGVRFIGVAGTWVWIGGTFTQAGGQTHTSIAALDATTGASNANVSSSVVQYYGFGIGGGYTYVCTGFNGNYSISMYDSATGLFVKYGPTVDGSVDAFAYDASSGYMYIGGSFAKVGGLPRNGSASFDPAFSAVRTWAPTANAGISGSVRAIAVNATSVFIGGTFTGADGNNRDNLFAADKSAGTVSAWNPGAGAAVRALATDGNMVYVGGEFGTVNTVRRNNAVALNATSGTPTDWTPNPNGEVDAILPIGSTVYLGGAFTAINWLSLSGAPRNRVAAVDNALGNPLSFDANANSSVLAFGWDGAKLYLGGSFSTVGGVARVGLAAVNPTTGALDSWTPNCNSSVYAMRVLTSINVGVNPKVIVGGAFTSLGGAVRNYIGAVDGVTGTALTWNPNANGSVHQILAFGTLAGAISKVYAAGAFSSIGGQPRSCIAALDGAGAATAWNPGASSTVYALGSLGNNIYLGGAFTSAGGQTRSHIAEIDATTGAATAWDPVSAGGAPSGWVYTIFKMNSTVCAGGSFNTMKGEPQQYFAMIGDATVTAVEGQDVPAAPRAVLASPNPFETGTVLRFALPRSEDTVVDVYDVAGRRVRRIQAGMLGAGEHRLAWDGLDERAHAVASGIYFLSVRTPTLRMGSKVYRLR